jgi:hypothetical protein
LHELENTFAGSRAGKSVEFKEVEESIEFGNLDWRCDPIVRNPKAATLCKEAGPVEEDGGRELDAMPPKVKVHLRGIRHSSGKIDKVCLIWEWRYCEMGKVKCDVNVKC